MQRNPRLDLYIIGLAYISFICLGLNAGLLGVAWLSIRDEFDVPLSSQGILLVATTIGYLTASFFSGTLAARFTVGKLYTVGIGMMALGLFIASFTQSWWLLVIILLISGLGGGIIDAGLNAYMAQHHNERVMNWLHASFGVGVTITPLIMTAVFASQMSWRVGYLAIGIVIAIITVLFFVMRRGWRSPSTPQPDLAAADRSDAQRVSIGSTLRLPIVWIGIATLAFCAGLETVPGNWIFSTFTLERGIPEVEAAQWISVYWGSFTVGRIFFGAIITRLNTSLLPRLCLLLALLGAGMLWWNPVAWVSFVGLTLLGFAQAPLFPVLISNTPRLVGQKHAANAIGFQVAGAGLGFAIIPAIAGVIAERTSLEVIPPITVVVVVTLLSLYQIAVMWSKRAKRAETAVPAPVG